MIVSVNNDKAIGKMYNVEWYLGKGKLQTTSAILCNVGDGYFYFEYPSGGLFIVEQKAIRSLECIEEKGSLVMDEVFSKMAKIGVDLGFFRDYFKDGGELKLANGHEGAVSLLNYDIELHKEIIKFLQNISENKFFDNPMKIISTKSHPTKLG